MIRIEDSAWKVMLEHAIRAYPGECCGILLGQEDEGGQRTVSIAVPSRNAYQGDQSDRFLIDPRDQIAADRRARITRRRSISPGRAMVSSEPAARSIRKSRQ